MKPELAMDPRLVYDLNIVDYLQMFSRSTYTCSKSYNMLDFKVIFKIYSSIHLSVSNTAVIIVITMADENEDQSSWSNCNRPMTCKLFGDRQNICKVLKLVEGVTIKLDVFEASNNKVSLQTRLISSLLTSKARP
ncbi:hypothetical protein QL285_027242 [Trifolium repens]|nr:hypothetical protein QL285_027242 [Trifolium repens]